MLDYKLLDALEAVAEEGGFERAARRLNLTQSAVSQRVRQLEEAAGGPVLTRGQPPAPTDLGRRLLRHARRVRLLEDELQNDFALPGRANGTAANGEQEAWRRISLAVNADSLATWIAGALLPLLTRERLMLDMRVDDQERTLEMLRAGEVAGCVSARETPLRGCRAVFLGTMRYHCAAAPAFAERWFPRGLTAEAAALAPAVVFNRHDSVHDSYLAALLGHSPADAPRHHVPDSARFVDFVAGGAGYGLIPHLQAADRLAGGCLVDLAPDRPMPVALYWHCWNIPSELLAKLTRALREGARRDLFQA